MKIHQTAYLKQVHSIPYKIYLNKVDLKEKKSSNSVAEVNDKVELISKYLF